MCNPAIEAGPRTGAKLGLAPSSQPASAGDVPAAGSARFFYSYRGHPGTGDPVWVAPGQGDFEAGSGWDEVLPSAVEAVTVGGSPGEYVQGGFVQRPGESQATWVENVPMARLRWK